jgi:lipoate synthase
LTLSRKYVGTDPATMSNPTDTQHEMSLASTITMTSVDDDDLADQSAEQQVLLLDKILLEKKQTNLSSTQDASLRETKSLVEVPKKEKSSM